MKNLWTARLFVAGCMHIAAMPDDCRAATWQGALNGNANDAAHAWFTAGNWNPGTPPELAGDIATFPNTLTGNLTLYSGGSGITLKRLVNESVAHEINLNGGGAALTFASGDASIPSVVSSNTAGSTGPDVTTLLYLPILGSQGLRMTGANEWSAFRFNAATDWSGFSGELALTRGYLAPQAASSGNNLVLPDDERLVLGGDGIVNFELRSGRDQTTAGLSGSPAAFVFNETQATAGWARLTVGDATITADFAGTIGCRSDGTRTGTTEYVLHFNKRGSGTQTLSGPIVGSGSVTVNAAGGTLVLSGPNTYAGATTVNAGGTLLIHGTHTQAGNAGNYTVAGTLGGTGTIVLSDATGSGSGISVSGTLAPGSSMTLDGGNSARPILSFASGGRLAIQLATGLSSTRIEVAGAQSGDVAFNNTVIDFSAPAGLPTGLYTLMHSDLDATYAGLTLDASSHITGGLSFGNGLGSYPGSYLKKVGGDLVLVLLNPASSVPAAPANLTATGGNRHIEVAWGPAEQAIGYRILRSTSANGSFELLGTVEAPTTQFTDSTCVIGVAYFYQVVGTNPAGEGTSALSAPVTSYDDGRIDTVVFGDSGSEASHALAAVSSESITGALDQPARRLLPLDPVDINGGSLSVTMTVDPLRRNYVTVRFWGGDDTSDQMGRIYLYVPINGTDYQVGFRHEGDYMPLSVAASKPPLPGRFFYSTTLLPLWMTQGKTSLTIKLVSTGRLYGLGSGGPPTGNYQFNMTVPSRGIYRAYTHVAAILTPDGEVQGSAPAATVRPGLSEASVLGPTGTYTNGLNGYVNGRLAAAITDFNTTDVALLARSHSVPRITAGYQNPAVVNKVMAVLDGFAADYYANPADSVSTNNYGRTGGNEVWGGRLGPLGWAIHSLLPQLQPNLDTVVNYGAAGGDRTRRQAWGDMLVASFDYGRLNRNPRTITNQTLITSENIYKANRGALDLGHPAAVTEAAAQRYLREAIGLAPWLGSDLPGGGTSNKLGTDYFQVTPQGLSREWGYVGGYGEMQGYAAAYHRYTGNPEFRDQAVKMIKARAPFRRPGLEVSGSDVYRTMERTGLLAWRGVRECDGDFSNEVTYGEPGSWSAAMQVAGMTLDPHAVGYAKQMIGDNQFFSQLIADSRYYSSLGFDARQAFEVYDDYEAVKNAPDSGIRLPMTSGQSDFVWKDEQSGIIAIKRGEERLWVAPYWQAKAGTAINGIGRFHFSTPAYDQYGVLETLPQYQSSGAWHTRSTTQIDYPERTLWAPPSPPLQAYGGERLPIGFVPPGVSDDAPYRGKADFWAFRFGRYLIGMNRSAGRSFDLKTPFGFNGAADLVSGSTMTGPVTVPPESTVALCLDQAYDPAPRPSSPLLLIANGSSLEWSGSSGATSYRVKRSPAVDGVYETVADDLTATTWTDPAPLPGAFYQVHAVNSHGESDSPSRVSLSAGSLPPPWQSADIGSTGLSGGASFADGTFTVHGAGTNLTGSGDAFHFAWRSLDGNGVLIARLASRVIGGVSDDKVGIMLRESTATNARNLAVFLDDLYDLGRASWRTTNGGTTSTADGLLSYLPVWLKIERSGNTIRGYHSSDGAAWTLVTTQTIAFSPQVLAGLFVCSRNTDALGFGGFDHVSLTTSMPATPPSLTASAGNATAELDWTPAEHATGYRLMRSLASGGPYAAIAELSEPGFTDSGLTNTITYHYVVTAVNPMGESAPSPQASATPIGAEHLRPPSITVGVGGQVSLGVANSVVGRTYQLQRSDTLAGWIDVGAALQGNGGLLSFDETVDADDIPRRFYRVVIGP